MLEVKGDFCKKCVRSLHASDATRTVEISLDSNYRYNPLHNDLDAYALAYGIASLISNLFGRGKELSLAKMLSGANAFEISHIQEDEAEAALTWRSGCNDVALGRKWLDGVFGKHNFPVRVALISLENGQVWRWQSLSIHRCAYLQSSSCLTISQ